MMIPASRSSSRVWHSHTTKGSQPASCSACRTRLSRSVFLANFERQKSTFEAGVVAYRQPGWRCQKHPWTRMTFRRDGNTRSGRPGKSRRWSRKRYPRRWARRRTAISGRVSRPRMPDITFDRFSAVKTSMRRPIQSVIQFYRSASYEIKFYRFCLQVRSDMGRRLSGRALRSSGTDVCGGGYMERSDDGLPVRAAGQQSRLESRRW